MDAVDLTLDSPNLAGRPGAAGVPVKRPAAGASAARTSLRNQIARLERELSCVVAEGFPYLTAPRPAATQSGQHPHLLSFAELERLRDHMVGQLHELQRQADEHAKHVRHSRELLEQMKLEPARYKFTRLRVRDLGEGGCGVWKVQPRLGVIGMLAGWWQLKLSSGCPLPKGRAMRRDPTCPRMLSFLIVGRDTNGQLPVSRWVLEQGYGAKARHVAGTLERTSRRGRTTPPFPAGADEPRARSWPGLRAVPKPTLFSGAHTADG
jgi:hypothetical protein